MVQLTPQAQELRDRYLADVRAHLAAAGRGEADDVLRDVEEHIDRELQAVPQPVSADDLQAVLARLGKPSQWIPEEELPWWRRFLLRLRTGPEDWRLAYATFGVLLLGLFMAAVAARGYGLATFSAFALAACILARAAVASVPEPNRLPAGQKWLTYPPLIFWYAILAFLILAWPIAAGAGASEYAFHVLRNSPHLLRVHLPFLGTPGVTPITDLRAGLFGVFVVVLTAGIWWSILGALTRWASFRSLVQATFSPFLTPWPRRLSLAILLAGIALILLSALFAAAGQVWGHLFL